MGRERLGMTLPPDRDAALTVIAMFLSTDAMPLMHLTVDYGPRLPLLFLDFDLSFAERRVPAGAVTVAPEPQIDSCCADRQRVERDLGKPAREHGIDKQPVVRRITTQPEDRL